MLQRLKISGIILLETGTIPTTPKKKARNRQLNALFSPPVCHQALSETCFKSQLHSHSVAQRKKIQAPRLYEVL